MTAAEGQFRRVKGYRQLPQLARAVARGRLRVRHARHPTGCHSLNIRCNSTVGTRRNSTPSGTSSPAARVGRSRRYFVARMTRRVVGESGVTPSKSPHTSTVEKPILPSSPTSSVAV